MGTWTDIRDTAETAAVLYGNYLLPGSSMVTKELVSDGSKEQLDSDAGKLAQLGTGGSGVADGNLANYTGGEGAGSPLPSFLSGPPETVTGLDLGGPGSGPGYENSLQSGLDLGGPGGSPATMPDSGGPSGKMAPNVNQSKKQQPQDEQTDDTAAKNARRQSLMEKAQSLREKIAALRAQVSRESSVPQTVLGNPA